MKRNAAVFGVTIAAMAMAMPASASALTWRSMNAGFGASCRVQYASVPVAGGYRTFYIRALQAGCLVSGSLEFRGTDGRDYTAYSNQAQSVGFVTQKPMACSTSKLKFVITIPAFNYATDYQTVQLGCILV